MDKGINYGSSHLHVNSSRTTHRRSQHHHEGGIQAPGARNSDGLVVTDFLKTGCTKE